MVRRSFAFAFADKTTALVLQLATMAVVSRLMTPAEVGLFMISSSLVIMIEAFRDFGVASFLIQEPKLEPELVRSAVTIIGLLSLGLGLLTFLSAGLFAAIYGDPELGGLIRLASLAFLAAPISNPLLALLRRDMNFGAVARINIAAMAANAVITMSLAFTGHGPVSFAWGALSAAFINAAGAALYRPEWWIFKPSLKHWRRVVPFGAWTSAVTLLHMLYEAMPRLLLGRILGFNAVGLFTRAVSLNQLPDRLLLNAVQPVVLPAFAAKARNHESLSPPYLLGLSMISGLQWPALLALALLADPIVRLLMGQQWMEVVPLVRILAIAMLPLVPSYLAFPLLVTLGRIKLMAIVTLVTFPIATLIVLVCAQFSLTAVAWGMLVANTVQVGAMLVAVRRHAAFNWSDFGMIAVRSGAVALCTAAFPAALVAMHGPALSVPLLAAAVIGAAACWVIGLMVVSHPLSAEITRLVETLRRFRLGSNVA
ncbi:oligosaccharide flippase family protein [Tropicimonas isoalkanivorans]|uniref:Membrane protein involved in the export of O-antigen and teichoic acid n=1 Tax=Tropicimonas isoalkanivorans TaxID=441112 RepID=A0A1I1LLK3_9RHOB|nr:oligosaccharide flippase family protein [Tropicimonas isoalkanivorans]SFC73826.1 Membrane protein involved in the export of O-antigen and teichoic acid [Tropicimonas isoalkanivorans]